MRYSKKVIFSLQQLKTLVYESRGIESDLEALLLELRQTPIDPSIWKLEQDITSNVSHIKAAFGESSDLIVREFVASALNFRFALAFLEELVNKKQIDTHVISDLMNRSRRLSDTESSVIDIEFIKTKCLSVDNVKTSASFMDVVNGILSGKAALFVDGTDQVLLIEARGWETRAISEPETEAAVNAPKEGLNETLKISISQIRRRIKDVNLVVKTINLGKRSQTDVAILFIKGVVNLDYVATAIKRLGSIQIDRILGVGDVEALIVECPGSPFPQVIKTERPDKTVAALTDGQVAILIDGTPIAIIVPATLPQFFQTVEDYDEHWAVSSLIRVTRYASILLSLTLPSLYIALVGFHPGLIPSELAFTIGKALSGIPFPVLFEAMFLLFSIEVLQEAGLRLPKPIGPTIGIVGGIVIGEAAVRANLVSPVLVVVIALTAITSYAQSNYSFSLAIRFLRLPLMVAASVLGLYGLMLGLLLILSHICSIKSFGVSYLAPFAPVKWNDIWDTLFRKPTQLNVVRPEFLDPADRERQSPSQKGANDE